MVKKNTARRNEFHVSARLYNKFALRAIITIPNWVFNHIRLESFLYRDILEQLFINGTGEKKPVGFLNYKDL